MVSYVNSKLGDSISRFLGQSPVSENKSVAAFYICPYIDHERTNPLTAHVSI